MEDGKVHLPFIFFPSMFQSTLICTSTGISDCERRAVIETRLRNCISPNAGNLRRNSDRLTTAGQRWVRRILCVILTTRRETLLLKSKQDIHLGSHSQDLTHPRAYVNKVQAAFCRVLSHCQVTEQSSVPTSHPKGMQGLLSPAQSLQLSECTPRVLCRPWQFRSPATGQSRKRTA